MPNKDPEVNRARGRRWRQNNKEHCRKKQAEYYKKNPTIYLLNACRHRSKKKGLICTLTKHDIVIPATCPILGIPLSHGSRPFLDNSPSIDQIIAGKGYTKDNIVVISFRANRFKSDSSLDELKKLVEFYDTLLAERSRSGTSQPQTI